MDAVLARLKAAGCHQQSDPLPGTRSPACAFDPPDVVVAGVDKHGTVRELVRYAISRSVLQLIDHHAGVWLTTDSEEVHQFRVATRRLRSDLRTLAPLLDRHWTAFVRDELRWLGGEVGRARDADVLVERLRAQVKRLAPEDAKIANRLVDHTSQNAAEARQHVAAAMSTDRYQALLDVLVEAARDPRLAADPRASPTSRAATSRHSSCASRGRAWARREGVGALLAGCGIPRGADQVEAPAMQPRRSPVAGRDARRFAGRSPSAIRSRRPS